MGGFRFSVGLFFPGVVWGRSPVYCWRSCFRSFRFFQVFSGFFGLVEGILVGCCSDLFGSVRIATNRFAGLSRGARWLVGVRGRSGMWLGVGSTLALPFSRSSVLIVAWLGRVGSEVQGLQGVSEATSTG